MKHICGLVSMLILLTAVLAGCSQPTKAVHCDSCGKEVKIAADSNMDDDWIIYCKDCEKELGLDQIVPEK